MWNFGEHRRLVEIAPAFEPLTPCEQSGACRDSFLNLMVEFTQDLCRGQRADFRLCIHWVADLQRSHGFYEAPFELIINGSMNDEPFRGDARLAAVDDSGLDCRIRGLVQVSARHNDERIAAAEFENGFLDLLACLAGHVAAGGLTACQGYSRDAGVIKHAWNLIGFDEQRLKLAIREARAAEDFFDCQRALRHVGGMFQ